LNLLRPQTVYYYCQFDTSIILTVV
jgi:hypothetical protein